MTCPPIKTSSVAKESLIKTPWFLFYAEVIHLLIIEGNMSCSQNKGELPMTRTIDNVSYTVAITATGLDGESLEYLIHTDDDQIYDLVKTSDGVKVDDIFSDALSLQDAFCYFQSDLAGFEEGTGFDNGTYKFHAGYTGTEDNYRLVVLD